MALMQRRTEGSRLVWLPQDGGTVVQEKLEVKYNDEDGKEKEMKKKDGMKFVEKDEQSQDFSLRVRSHSGVSIGKGPPGLFCDRGRCWGAEGPPVPAPCWYCATVLWERCAREGSTCTNRV